MRGSIKVMNSEHTRFRVKQRRMTTVVVICIIAGVTALTFSLHNEAGFSNFFKIYLGSDEKNDSAT